jgi:hypothetical protein
MAAKVHAAAQGTDKADKQRTDQTKTTETKRNNNETNDKTH